MKTLFRYKFPLLILTIFIIATCKKDEEVEREYPRINTSNVSDITENGAVFNGEIYKVGNEAIIDHGFIWHINKGFKDYGDVDKISLGSFSGIGNFSAEIKTTLEANKEYFVRSYVKTAKYFVYGEEISFISLGSQAPTISDFDPKTAGWGDTITIKGKNFSRLPTTNKVFFGNTSAKTYPQNSVSNDSTFSVIVPSQVGSIKNLIAVEIVGNRATFTADTFKLIPPNITDFKPKQGFWGDTIKVYGKYLNYTNTIKLNQINCHIVINKTKDSLSFLIPNDINQLSNTLSLSFSSFNFILQSSFTLTPPLIKDFRPKTTFYNSKVTLYGKFNPISMKNTVKFNDYTATIVTSSRDSIEVLVPLLSNTYSQISYNSTPFTVNAPETFQLSSPIIDGFSPSSGAGGEYVTIDARNFYSNKIVNNATSVLFNNVSATITSISQSKIVVIVPNNISGKFKIKLKCFNQIVESADLFNVTNPVITDFNPKTATFRDTITILGENFDPNNGATTVKLVSSWSTSNYGTSARVVSVTPNKIKAIVADETEGENKKISVTVRSNYNMTSDFFTLLPPEISSITPNSGGTNQSFVINGDYFGNLKLYDNYVQIGNFTGTVVSTERTKIVASFSKITRGVHDVVINWGNLKSQNKVTYTCNSPWLLLGNTTYTQNFLPAGISFAYNNIGYIFTSNVYAHRLSGGKTTLFAIDPTDNSIKQTDLPYLYDGVAVFNTTNFGIQSKVYLVSGQSSVSSTSKSVYSIDILTNQWYKLNDFPGEFRKLGFTFSFSDKAYIGGGGKTDFWEYNPSGDTWTQKATTPFSTADGESASSITGDKGYIILRDKSVWEYNSISDVWTKKTSFPGNSRYFPICFVIGNTVYYGSGRQNYDYLDYEYDDIWAYNIQTDTWTQKQTLPGQKRAEASSVTIGNKGYFGFGRNPYGYNYYRMTDVYEYDPTLEP